MLLQSQLVLLDSVQIGNQRHGDVLNDRTGASIQERAGLRQCFDDAFWTDHPAASEAWQSEILGEAIDDDASVFVDVFDESSGRMRGAFFAVLVPVPVRTARSKDS
jgi:hypothetical protein